MSEIKQIPEKFTKRGIEYEQIEVGRAYMIYRCSLFGSFWYEVFQKRINAARVIAGVEIPAGEAFPGDEAFGRWAWTSPDLGAVQKRAASIMLHSSLDEVKP